MKNSRPRIKFSQTPHSISRRIETISNKTAGALLSLLTRKTIGFGQGSVNLPYRQISNELGVGPRAIQEAARRLEEWGDIIRERVAHQIYRWRVVLERDEVLEDPNQIYVTKSPSQDSQVRIDRSGPCRSFDPDHADRSIRTQVPNVEQENPCETYVSPTFSEQENQLLNNSSKEEYLKKQQQEAPSKAAPAANDDEPLHKICLRGLQSHGVRQRVARMLCRDHEHTLIKSVLDTVPTLSGVENIAGYLVAAIKDGGYELVKKTPAAEQKNGRSGTHSWVSGGRSNYAHLTDHNVKSSRHSTVKTATDAPITSRSVEQTQTEIQNLEEQKAQKEQAYRQKGQQLVERFKSLSQDLQLQIKLIASVHLSKLVPASQKREEILKDKTFRRMANRTILEHFFEWVDQGLDELQALQRLESKAVA